MSTRAVSAASTNHCDTDCGLASMFPSGASDQHESLKCRCVYPWLKALQCECNVLLSFSVLFHAHTLLTDHLALWRTGADTVPRIAHDQNGQVVSCTGVLDNKNLTYIRVLKQYVGGERVDNKLAGWKTRTGEWQRAIA